MRISVIVPTFNEEKNIENFLIQFERQTLPRKDFEIIIVDGGSTDRTREIASLYADKVILQKSRGIGGARNDGAKVAQSPFIATTDADVILPNFWLERILKHFDNSNVVAVCGSDGPIERNAKTRILYFFIRNIIHGASVLGLYCTGGTNSAFRKEVFEKIGGYKSLPHSDDVEIAFRLKREGRIVYDRNLFVRMSVRRLEKRGYFNTLLLWLKGDLRLIFGLDIKEIDYAREKY